VTRFSSVKAIAFDLDQTLIDFAASRRAGLSAMLDAIEKAGHTIDRTAYLARYRALIGEDDDHYLKTGVWRPTERRLRQLAVEFALPGDGFAERLGEVYLEARYANLRPYPETDAALRAVAPRFPLFLITNGPSAPQHREIDVTGLAPFFRKLFVCDDFGLHKPQEEMFELVRKAAGVKSEEMLIVGDYFEADIEVPAKLGWKTVWVVRDDDERARADPRKADAVVRSVGEVPALLGVAKGQS
jgi:2-haloacid dehalogenase